MKVRGRVMNICFRLTAVIFCLVLLMAGTASAQSENWRVDTDHSSIYFDTRHTLATVRGQFKGFTGTVDFDPDNLTAGSVEFTVRVDTINTGINKRDNHLRSDDFFATGQYPEMTFSSTGIRHMEDNRYIMEGDLTVRDVTRRVEIPFTYLGIRDNPLEKGQEVSGFEAEFAINRLDYNVGDGRFAEMGVVGKQVRVLVALELLRDK